MSGVTVIVKGSASSGNYGHAGRPGERGGSAASGALAMRSENSDGSDLTPAQQSKIAEVYARHPDSIVKACKKVVVFKDSKELEKFVKTSPNFKGKKDPKIPPGKVLLGVYDPVGKQVLTTSTNAYVLDHEIGHAVAYRTGAWNKWFDAKYMMPRDGSSYKKIDDFTKYSKTNDHEAIAESYVAYIRANGKTTSPRVKPTFDLIKRMIG